MITLPMLVEAIISAWTFLYTRWLENPAQYHAAIAERGQGAVRAMVWLALLL